MFKSKHHIQANIKNFLQVIKKYICQIMDV